MLFVLGTALVLVVLAIALYLFFFLKRMFLTFGANVRNKWIRIALIVLAAMFAVLSAYIMNVVSIVILHVVVIGLIIQFINFIIKRISKNKYNEKFSAWKKIYGSGILPIVLTVVVMLLGYSNLHSVVGTNYTVYTDKNIRPQGYRVALIADVHFGVSLDYDDLLKKCNEISARDVDIVVLCGDIVDNSTTAEEMRAVFESFGGIDSKYGVYYVYGNHDRPMSLLRSEYTSEELLYVIESNGITVLKDDVVKISDDLVLIGREDRSAGERQAIDELLARCDEKSFLLTLDHQPNQYVENGQAGTDLLLSGHTHGGQLFPLNIVMRLFGINDGVYGQYQIDSDTQAIVTSGFAGWNYSVKTAAPAEYVIIDILPT